MNVERLHAIAIAVIDDINTTKLLETLTQLVTSLQNQVNQPQTPELQNQVSQHLRSLYDALDNSGSNDYSPAWTQSLKELGVHDLLGNSLHDSIVDIFERNKITPAIALQDLQEFQSRLSDYKEVDPIIRTG